MSKHNRKGSDPIHQRPPGGRVTNGPPGESNPTSQPENVQEKASGPPGSGNQSFVIGSRNGAVLMQFGKRVFTLSPEQADQAGVSMIANAAVARLQQTEMTKEPPGALETQLKKNREQPLATPRKKLILPGGE